MYCTQCGAEIEPGFSFCTRCGASLHIDDANEAATASPSAATSVVAGPSRNDDRRSVNAWLDDDSTQDADAWLNDGPQFGDYRDAPVYTDQPTAYVPPIAYTNPVSYRSAGPNTPIRPVETPSEKKSRQGTSRGSAIAIVVLLLIALGILIGLLAAILTGGLNVENIGTAANELVSGLSDTALDTESVAASNTADEDEEENEEGEAAADEDTDTDTDTADATSATLTDAEAYSALAAAYDALSGYNSQISDVATDFNSYYAATSYDTRSTYAAEAESVLAAVTAAYEDALSLAISESSSYYSTWEDICSLYYYLQQRIAVMCEAWEVSLSYDDPSGHQDEILAPIVAARGDDGSNRYLSAYNALYASAEPEAPSE